MGVGEVLEAIRALSPDERAQVRALLDTLPDSPIPSEDKALARLRSAGLLGETVRRPATGRSRRTPVEIKGTPLSRTVIDERR